MDGARRLPLSGQQVEQREQQDPDDIDEVPVERGPFDGIVMPSAELAGHPAIQDDREHHDATEDVKRQHAYAELRDAKAEEDTELWLRRLRDEAFVEYRM